MSEEVEIDKLEKLINRCNECKFATCENCEINWTEVQAIKGLLDLYKNIEEIEKTHKEENGKLRVELEKYKRLAEMNLKDAEEFQENMCEHRCILYNEKEELKADLYEANNIISDYIDTTAKQEKMIEYMVNWINDHEDPFEGCHENEKCGDDYISCEQCIKQYFEKKAEENL